MKKNFLAKDYITYYYVCGKKVSLLFGDAVAVILDTYTLSQTKEDFIKEIKEFIETNFIAQYHISYGYCDSLDVENRDKEYYAGYLFGELTTAHKNRGEEKWQ